MPLHRRIPRKSPFPFKLTPFTTFKSRIHSASEIHQAIKSSFLRCEATNLLTKTKQIYVVDKKENLSKKSLEKYFEDIAEIKVKDEVEMMNTNGMYFVCEFADFKGLDSIKQKKQIAINDQMYPIYLIEEEIEAKPQNILPKAKDWLPQYFKFEAKWHSAPEHAEHRAHPSLELYDQVVRLEADWYNVSGEKYRVLEALRKQKALPNAFSGRPYGVDDDTFVDDPAEEEKIALARWAKQRVEMVTLSNEERLQYAQMVKSVEAEHETHWGEATPDLERWDEDWPRYILPDGTPLPHLEDPKAVDEWKRRIERFQRRKHDEKEKNAAVSALLKDKAESLVELAVLGKLILLKMGCKNPKVLDFAPRMTSRHSFLADLRGGYEEREEGGSVQGSSTKILEEVKAFAAAAGEELSAADSGGEALQEELQSVLGSLGDAVKEIEEKMAERAKSSFCSPFEDPRIGEEIMSDDASRQWAILAGRQQKLFEAIPQNQREIRQCIANNFYGAQLEKDSDKIVLPENRKKVGNKVVDEHFEKLVEALNNADGMTGEERLEYFKKIPATIGGPGAELGELERNKET